MHNYHSNDYFISILDLAEGLNFVRSCEQEKRNFGYGGHLQSLTTGLWPGTGKLTYFRRFSTSNLFALNSIVQENSRFWPNFGFRFNHT